MKTILIFIFGFISFADENTDIIIPWDYYQTTEFVQQKNEINSLYNIPWVGKISIDGKILLNEILYSTSNIKSLSSFSSLTLWQNNEQKSNIYWCSLFSQDKLKSILQINGDQIDNWISNESEIFVNLGKWIKLPFENAWQNMASSFLSIDHILHYLEKENILAIDIIKLDNSEYGAFNMVPKNITDFFYFLKLDPNWKTNIFGIYKLDTKELVYIFLTVHTKDENDSSFAYTQSFFNFNCNIIIELPTDFIDATKAKENK